MNFRKKLPVILVISLLAGIVGAAAPAYSQAITEQPKLVVFESVGSTT